jgi:trimeric autotransporter adhesin
MKSHRLHASLPLSVFTFVFLGISACSNDERAAPSKTETRVKTTKVKSPVVKSTQARRADQFVDSVGMNVHLEYSDTAYNNFEGVVVPSLEYLGVRHVRAALSYDGEIVRRERALSNRGIGILGLVPYRNPSIPKLVTQIEQQVDMLEAVEGPNETDEFKEFEYKGRGFPAGTAEFMRVFSRAMKASAKAKQLSIVQTSLAFPEGEREGDTSGKTRTEILGDLSQYADFGNSHNYISWGDTPSDMASTRLPFIKQTTRLKPYMSTEGGYQMGNSDGLKGKWSDGKSAPFDTQVQARYMTRYLLEMFRQGYSRSYIYELLDIDEPQWGMFEKDGSPKLAADGIHALLRLLSDCQFNGKTRKWETKLFRPGSLAFTLSGVPDTVHSVLLQKSNGKFSLVVWNEVKNWDATMGKPVEATPITTTLTINDEVMRIRTFDPNKSGTKPAITYDRKSAVSLNILDRPTVVEIQLAESRSP